MYKSYFKIGWRNLVKNKWLSVINIVGLSMGIATCTVIMLFVVDELSFDRFNEKADQIVRVVLRGNVNGEIIKEAVTAAPVGQTLVNEFPEVLEATRLRRYGSPKISYRNNVYRDSKVAFVDANFFQIFTLPIIHGDTRNALKEPYTVVITQRQALKYFGNEDPLNKLLDVDDGDRQYRVTGVIKDVPENSHFHFDMFMSMEEVADAKINNWMESRYFTYLVLANGTDRNAFEQKLPAIIAKYMGPQVSQMGMTFEKFTTNGNVIGLFVQRLTDIHLFSDFDSQSELEAGGDINTVYMFGAVAVFMLLIACINFMNLATAGASSRNKEIGVKKALGSLRSQLVRQFLIESSMSTMFSMLIALMMVAVALPVFNELSGKNLETSFLLRWEVLSGFVFVGIVIALVSGSYPAFFLSAAKPVAALKGRMTTAGHAGSIRSGLVIFQFVISSALILAIIIVGQQMSFILNKEVGYDKDQLLVLRETALLGQHENVFRNELLKEPMVESITMSAFVPAGPTDNNMTGVYREHDKESVRRTIVYNIDDRYIPTLGMKLISGRNFMEGRGDSLNVIVNETAVKIFGLGSNPIGQTLMMAGNASTGDKRLTVIGIIKDFHFRSLHESIAPLIMLNNPYGGLIVKSKSREMARLISGVEKKWKAFNMDEPFSYALLDELYNETYLSEQKMGKILNIFGILTILVACLGLFGLVTFSAQQRIKEIGIRKVLGANVTQIVSLLSKDLIILVSISFVIAFPFGYFLMSKWLQGFAYRVEVQWWVYVLAATSTLVIAFITMGFRTISSALANPVDSLRSE
jgi:putative ABC transport system permease protein